MPTAHQNCLTSMPKYLLDTNIVSEPMKRRPNQTALNWLETKTDSDLYLSVLTIGEMRKGAELLKTRDVARANKLNILIDDIEKIYADRILPITTAIAARWGQLSADRTRPTVDTLLAATAIEHQLVLATRNTKDFEDTGAILENPYADGGTS